MIRIFTGTQIIYFAFHNVSLDNFKNIDLYTLSFWQTIIYFNILICFCLVMSDSLKPHELQHVRLPVLPVTSPWVCSISCSESVMLSNHLILCQPLLLMPSVFPSIMVFFNDLTLCITWPKYWSFNFSINPSNEYSGLISFRIDWLDLIAVQETSRVFSNTTVQKHQFFSAQLSL